jgi:hypothetical protein
MANAAAARVPCELELTPTPTPPSESDRTLGQVVADAAAMIAKAIEDCRQTGVLASTTKAAGSIRLARVAELALAHELGDPDFYSRARAAGLREMRQYLDADFFRRHSPAEADAAFNMYMDGLFEIVANAIKDERAIRAALAN